MSRLLHLSDLHFGRTRMDLVAPLLKRIEELAPDLVVVSGDLTQRARRHQFREAKSFIDRIRVPVLTVPGNHDVPLDEFWVRLLRPFSRYRKIVNRDLEPGWSDDEMEVVGVNTVNPLAWQSGRIHSHTVRRVCDAFDARPHKVRVVALHHPLEHAPGVDKKLMRGATKAAGAMAECGADVVLCGHLHSWRAGPMKAEAGEAETLLVQAGTGLSTRLRGEENDFNLLTLDPDHVRIDRYVAGATPTFKLASSHAFVRQGRGWREEAAGD
ncbi:metallophosphoesterase family protein [Tranquillimonas alkanivorans]|uniref:3',5'-cyclic AMP phosphodiesterase CpdA n=1 Tax=Tranquillimonas alkanivorans TaxID=441119 RepID=A0A1I5L0T2_9RHOB|nr:metallophosphoesterase family protein [Tranquillimonas alkanivorans]SFO90778.1 3',5'-cyclic AMP phosphodiesterase CpdA [Tranquillimonas alkanivorans]